jgi:hypothetical protein
MSLKKILKGLKRESQPKKKCKKALWHELEHRYDHMYPASPRLVSKPAVIIAVVVLIAISAGTSAYAYDSPEVVEGHPLHFIKKNIENFEGKLQFSPMKKVQWHLKIQDRRMEEAKHFMGKNDFRKKIFEKGMKEIPPCLDEARKIFPEDVRQKMLYFISQSEEEQIAMLMKLKPELSEYSQEEIDRMIAEHTISIQKKIEMMEQADQENFSGLRNRKLRIFQDGVFPEPEIVNFE